MCVCVCVLVAQLCLTLWPPRTVAHQAPLFVEFSRQEYWSGLPFLLQGIFPTQGLNLDLPHCRQILYHLSYHFSPVQSLSHVWLFVTPWTAARQASLSITNSQSLLKLMSIESVMPSNHLIIYRPLLLPSSIFPSIWVFSKESVLHIMWPKYWSFSFSSSPSNEYSGMILSPKGRDPIVPIIVAVIHLTLTQTWIGFKLWLRSRKRRAMIMVVILFIA